MVKQVSLAEWSKHLELAVRSGETLAGYARRHGLSRSGLYSARQVLKRRSAAGMKAKAPRGFLPVVVPGLRSRWTARLPNGVELALCGGDADTEQAWLLALSRLPCGG